MAPQLFAMFAILAAMTIASGVSAQVSTSADVVDYGRTNFPESKAINESRDAELKIVLKKPNDLWTCCLDDEDFCMKHPGVKKDVAVDGKTESRWVYPFVVETTRASCGKKFSFKVENRTQGYERSNSTRIFVQFKPNAPVIKRAQYDLRTNCLVVVLKPEDTGKCQLRYSVHYDWDQGQRTTGEFVGTKKELKDFEIKSCWKEKMYNKDSKPSITVEVGVKWNTMRSQFEEFGGQITVPVSTYQSNTTCAEMEKKESKPDDIEVRSSGKCDNQLAEDECFNNAAKNGLTDAVNKLGNGSWFEGGTYNDSSVPAGCSYTGSGAVMFNKAEGAQAPVDCSPSQPCLCKRKGQPSGGPPMKRFGNIKDEGNYTKLEGTSANAYIKTVAYSNVNGKDMQAGVLKLEKGNPLKFTHWYEGLAFVLEGEFRMTYGKASKEVNVTAGQSMSIPRGMEITYKSIASTSYLYFAIISPTIEQQALNRSQDQKLTIKDRAMDIYPNMSLFNNTQKSLSYLDDMLVAGLGQRDNLVGGLYKLLKGPALDYTYEYEEFKYIVKGEFVLTDGTGQTVSAKGGDLMYFPLGCAVHFTSPNYALGFYVGQRKWGTA